MAENLLSKSPNNRIHTPLDERNAAPGFGYAGGFQDILSAYNGLHHRGAKKRWKDNQNLFKEQIEHLTNLKQILEDQEDAFFDLFGIRAEGMTRRDCFKELYGRINEWNDTYASRLLNDASVKEFYEGLGYIERLAIAAEITEENWNYILNASFDTPEGREVIRNFIYNKEENNKDFNIADILNTILAKEKNSRPIFARSGKSSLIDNLTVEIQDDKIKITSDQKKISPAMQRKIITKLEDHFKLTRPEKPNYDFITMFNGLFDIMGIKSEARPYILKALGDEKQVLERYAFNSTESQIKGFLGEIYNNAFLYFMAKGKTREKEILANLTPTGAMRDISAKSKPEIIIDTWLKGIGIQVKNYEKGKVLKEGFTFHKSYQAGNFIQDAMQLSSVGTSNTASVGDILLNFFAAYDYNQDYGLSHPGEIPETKGYAFWRDARFRMDKRAKDSKALTNIMYPYIPTIIGIERKFQTEQIFVEETKYQNTFFNISGKYIPSSVLVSAIIDTLEKASKMPEGLLSANFRQTSYTKSKKDKWFPQVDNNIVAQVFEDRVDYANATRLSYNVNLDVQALSKYILEQI